MQGRPEGAPPPRQVEDWAAAEANAVAWLKWLGHRDARPTKPGADGGIDVIAMGAFAQVKRYGKPAGVRPLRELAGARANRPGTLYFFVNNRYTPAALAYAEEVGMAAFAYSPADGMIAPVSSAARRTFQSAVDGSRMGERRSRPAASPTEPPRQRQRSRTTGPSAATGAKPMGQVRKLRTSHATPAFAHAVETFLVAHTAVGAWSLGTAVKYRQTLTALVRAYLAGFGTIAPVTRVRYLSALRSALTWWREPAGWIIGDSAAGWAGPKVTMDSSHTVIQLARSRHPFVRFLERYPRPGPEAVPAHVAATDPAARRWTGQGR